MTSNMEDIISHTGFLFPVFILIVDVGTLMKEADNFDELGIRAEWPSILNLS